MSLNRAVLLSQGGERFVTFTDGRRDPGL